MTVDDMLKKVNQIDIRIEKIRYFISKQTSPISIGSANIRIRQLEAKKANLGQDIQDRILENQLEVAEVGETLRQIPGGSDE